jgi:hypothetical protein
MLELLRKEHLDCTALLLSSHALSDNLTAAVVPSTPNFSSSKLG